MIQRFLQYIEREKLIKPGEKILLAVSGGKDSMVMLDLFQRSKLPFGIAHINHSTRDGASDIDALFVKESARKLDVGYHEFVLEPSFSKSSNFQAKARSVRYEWLDNICSAHQYDVIATAHHQNDNIESFIMGLLRSAGTRGLSGIAPKRDSIIRPLLFASREEIDIYQEKHQIAFREDTSNGAQVYLRNKVRHTVLKVLNQVDDQAVKKIDESIRLIAESNDLLEYFINKEETIVEKQDGNVIINLKLLKALPSASAFLWFKINDLGFTKSDIIDMLDSSRNGATFETATHKATLDRDKILIVPVGYAKVVQEDLVLYVENPGAFQLDEKSFLKITIADHLEFGKKSNEEYLGFDENPLPLKLRKRKSGDVFKPLGMKGKNQKIKDFIVNNKLSIEDKNRLWLLVDKDDEVIAVVPHRISEPCKVTAESKFIIKLEYCSTVLKEA